MLSVMAILSTFGTVRKLLVVVLLLLLGSATLAEPRGLYPVGTREFVLRDDEERPLSLTVWYPALNPDDREESVRYGPLLARVEGRALRDAAPATENGPYPLVVFSHGSGTSRLLYAYLTEHLASQGFVVVAPDHPGNTINDLVRPGAFIRQVTPSYASRPMDILRVIDFARELPDLVEIIDAENIGLIGHSFGGTTVAMTAGATWQPEVLAAWCVENAGSPLDPAPEQVVTPNPASPEMTYGSCFLGDALADLEQPDPAENVNAVVLFAPWNAPLFGAEGLATVDAPLLVMGGTADNVTPFARDIRPYYEDAGSTAKSLVVLPEAGHFIFMAECPDFLVRLGQSWTCSDPVWEMAEAHAIITHLTTAFLKAELLGESDAPLLPENVNFEGIEYETTRRP